MFKKALALNPDFFSAGSDLYLSYIRLGETENADEQLKYNLQLYPKYLAIYPDDARGHMFYAIDLAQIGKMEEAKAEAAKALELNPGDPLMLYNSACFYAQLNEKNLALDSLRNAFLAGYQNFEWLKRDSDLDCLREEPVYIELMKGK